ncbi:MAG TPA: MBL fold metallo-hydrolase [Anaerovoracaceae bacterium]|nr:MBL fold metallo-hydrolase [Anaerovoracaceae bacterium]
MKIEKISSRNIIFKYKIADWDLNIQLIMGKKFNYIIDSGLGASSTAPIMEYLRNNSKPMILINTHFHWDHIWGNHTFKDCTIISHRLCRELILIKWDEMTDKNKQFIKGDIQMCLPNLVFEDTLYFPDDKIRIIYTPGHTTDSISVLDEEERIINVGDNIGDTMDEIVPSIGTNKDTYINTLQRYKSIDFDTCISGHNVTLRKEVFDMIHKELDKI